MQSLAGVPDTVAPVERLDQTPSVQSAEPSLAEVTGPSREGADPTSVKAAEALLHLDPSSLSRAEAAQILGVGQDATPKEIKSAYRGVARSFHPDAFPEATPEQRETFEAASKVVNGAKDVLLSTPAEVETPHKQESTEKREYQQRSSSSRTSASAQSRYESVEQEFAAYRREFLMASYFTENVGSTTGEHLSRKIENELNRGQSAAPLADRIIESCEAYLGREILGLRRNHLSPQMQEHAFKALEATLHKLGEKDLAGSIKVADYLIKSGVISKEDAALLLKDIIGKEARGVLDEKGRKAEHLTPLLEKITSALEGCEGLALGNNKKIREFLEESLERDAKQRGISATQSLRDVYLMGVALDKFTTGS